LTLEMFDEAMRPCGEILDNETFNTAMNSSPEMKSWVEQTLTTHRLHSSADLMADCAAAREWVTTREGHHPGDLPTLGRFARSFDPRTGYNTAPQPIQDRARWLLDQWRRHTVRHG
jgi:hypothetical protein